MSVVALSEGACEKLTVTMTDLCFGKPFFTTAFPATADQAAIARTVLCDQLKTHPVRDDGVLLASELAANAIRHSGSRYFVLTAAHLTGNRIRIAVIDEGDAGLPQLPDPEEITEGGRGIAIVETLATCWGIIRRPNIGTAVWFELSP